MFSLINFQTIVTSLFNKYDKIKKYTCVTVTRSLNIQNYALKSVDIFCLVYWNKYLAYLALNRIVHKNHVIAPLEL